MPTRLPNGLSYVKPNLYATRTDTITFVAGDVTPSVKYGSFFITANSAVTITNFDDGEQGKVLHVFSNSGGATTIQNSAGGINMPMVVYNISAGIVKVTTNTGNSVLLNNEIASFIHNGTDWSYLGTRIVDTNS